MKNYMITLSVSIASLFMTILTAWWDFLAFFLVFYYIAYMEFEKEIDDEK